MADEGTPEQNAPKKGKGKLIIAMAVIGLLLGGGGLAAYKFAWAAGKAKPEEEAVEPKKSDKPDQAPAQIVSLKPIVVNLRDTHGTRYLKVTIGLETRSEKVVEALNELKVPLNDFLIDRLSNMRIDEIDNSKGRNKLKRELLYGTNDLLSDKGSGVVSKLYFSEFVIQ